MDNEVHEPMASRWRMRFQVVEPFAVRHYQGSALRGILGIALKEAHCLFASRKDCRGCLLTGCPYRVLFEETAAEQGPGFGVREMPRPYVVEALDTMPRSYAVGEDFHFDLVLWGRTRSLLGTVAEACAHGFANLAYQGHHLLQEATPADLACTSACHEAVLRFHTPLRMTSNGRLLTPEEWSADSWLMALARRVHVLGRTYAQVPDADMGALGALARAVRLDACVELRQWGRYSNRQQARMDLPGYVGEVRLRGDLAPFVPYLRLGTFAHMGKGCVHGLGGYTLHGVS